MVRRWIALAAVLAAGQAAAQDSATVWSVAPAEATVGDTVWLERRLPLPAGWRVRPGRLDGGEAVEPLGDPVVTRETNGWTVRYLLTAWRPGAHTVTIPPIWRLGPDAQADSIVGGTVRFVVRSVIPDTASRPAPQPALGPLRGARRDLRPVLLASMVAVLGLASALWWRRRPPRRISGPTAGAPRLETADDRWLDAGEARAVAARAAGRLRAALAATVKEAHLGLSTADCLAVAERARPQLYAELAAVLESLDQVAFAAGADADVARLADRARALAGVLER